MTDAPPRLAPLRLRSTDTFAASTTANGDAVLFEATIATGAGVARVSDAFVLRAGRATHQVTGVISFAPGASGTGATGDTDGAGSA